MPRRIRFWIACALLLWHPFASAAVAGSSYDAQALAAILVASPSDEAATPPDHASDASPCHETRDAPTCGDCAACHLATALGTPASVTAKGAENGRLPTLAAASPKSFIPDLPRRPPLG
ncbi:MAG TPA: hypothetical protein VLW45_02965 [Pelomicrobium sp.]|nr:hypothetical protein [Pelomicrobium sp.]